MWGGSVFGADIYLENCVVLGGVFATKELKISNCVFGTFNAPSAEVSGVSYMLYPAAFSRWNRCRLCRRQSYTTSPWRIWERLTARY